MTLKTRVMASENSVILNCIFNQINAALVTSSKINKNLTDPFWMVVHIYKYRQHYKFNCNLKQKKNVRITSEVGMRKWLLIYNLVKKRTIRYDTDQILLIQENHHRLTQDQHISRPIIRLKSWTLLAKELRKWNISPLLAHTDLLPDLKERSGVYQPIVMWNGGFNLCVSVHSTAFPNTVV